MSDYQAAIDDALEHIWGGGIDYALSPDFKELTPDEKDALYIRYRDNLIAKAKQAIEEYATHKAVEELENILKPMLDKHLSGELGQFVLTINNRLAQLRNQEKETTNES